MHLEPKSNNNPNLFRGYDKPLDCVIGKNVERIRELIDYPPEQLAIDINLVTEDTPLIQRIYALTEIEEGDFELSAYDVSVLAGVLGVPICVLLFDQSVSVHNLDNWQRREYELAKDWYDTFSNKMSEYDDVRYNESPPTDY